MKFVFNKTFSLTRWGQFLLPLNILVLFLIVEIFVGLICGKISIIRILFMCKIKIRLENIQVSLYLQDRNEQSDKENYISKNNVSI